MLSVVYEHEPDAAKYVGRTSDSAGWMQIESRGFPQAAVLVFAALLLSGACASGATARGPAAFPGASVPTPAAVDAAPSPMVDAVIQTALSQLGTPYQFGGSTPHMGFDCSGLVWYALAEHHVDVPRTVDEQYLVGRPVGRNQLQPGDLVFFSTIGPGATHVGIVLDEPHTFVHAPSAGGVVRIERFDAPYWRSRYIGARRVF